MGADDGEELPTEHTEYTEESELDAEEKVEMNLIID